MTTRIYTVAPLFRVTALHPNESLSLGKGSGYPTARCLVKVTTPLRKACGAKWDKGVFKEGGKTQERQVLVTQVNSYPVYVQVWCVCSGSGLYIDNS